MWTKDQWKEMRSDLNNLQVRTLKINKVLNAEAEERRDGLYKLGLSILIDDTARMAAVLDTLIKAFRVEIEAHRIDQIESV